MSGVKVVRESVPVPGTDMSLVYVSSRAPGFMSTLVVRVTSRRPPPQLVLVHVRVVVQGVETQQVLAARPSLTYTFSWNKLNAYNQKVYGLTTATSTSRLLRRALLTATVCKQTHDEDEHLCNYRTVSTDTARRAVHRRQLSFS